MYPSALSASSPDFHGGFKEKIKDILSVKNFPSILKKLNAYFKDEHNKSKKKPKNKKLVRKIEIDQHICCYCCNFNLRTLYVIGFGLLVIPIPTGAARVFSLTD